jgi:hypothetical protein
MGVIEPCPTSLRAAKRSAEAEELRSVASAAESGKTTEVLSRAVKIRRLNNMT